MVFGLGILLVFLSGTKEFVQQQMLRENIANHRLVLQLVADIYDLNFLTYDYLQSMSDRAEEQWQGQYEKLNSSMPKVLEAVRFPEDAAKGIWDDYGRLAVVFEKIAENRGQQPPGSTSLNSELHKRLAAQMLIRSRAFYTKSNRLMDNSFQAMEKAHLLISMIGFGIFVIFTVLLVYLSFFILVPMYPRIAGLRLGFSKIAGGQLDHRVEVTSGDEFSQVEESFNKTVEQLSKTIVSRSLLEDEIIERREGQYRLEQVGKSLRMLTDSVFMFFAVSGKIFFTSAGTSSTLGFTEEELHTMSFAELLDEKDRTRLTTFLGRADRDASWQLSGTSLPDRTGQRVPMGINIEYVQMDDHTQNYCIAIARDMSAQKAYEQELLHMKEELELRIQERTRDLQIRVNESEQLNRAMINLLDDLQTSNRRLEETSVKLTQSNKDLEAFSYSVSHDLRAPLRSLSGFSQLLEKKSEGILDDKCLHYIRIISQSAIQMAELIDDLLNFSRIGRKALSVKRCNIRNLFQESIAVLEPELQGRTISWQLGDMPDVMVDQNLTRLVIINLISNAVKFTVQQDHANIVISHEEQEAMDIFVVKDNGVGFDMKYKDKLFNLFQRLHSQKDFKGTGVGLANVHRIIRRHGGDVWAEGALGEGAAFYFSIPKKQTGTDNEYQENIIG